ncbi:MAG: hypothetical protein KJ882_08940 [Proteobacteria bacterium]|nr:hypothetical protein [Pseudomonadota bacterium]
MESLLNYDYPGNVREMENIIEHALIISQTEKIELHHLPDYMLKRLKSSVPDFIAIPDNKKSSAGINEKEIILKALQSNNWNRSQAATALKMDRSTLWRKMKLYNIIKQLPE